MAEIEIKLDLDKESDRKMLEIITRFRAKEAQGETVNIEDAVNEALPKSSSSALPLIEAGKQVTRASQELSQAIGERAKLDTKTRARVAAKARWERVRAAKEGRPIPEKKSKPKKQKQSDNVDFSHAQEQPLVNYVEQRHEMALHALFDTSHLEHADGREIMEGTFKVPGNEESESDDNQSSEESFSEDDLPEAIGDEKYLRDIMNKAESYEE